MRCDDVRPAIDEYIDGTLSEGRIRIVESHILRCAQCREYLGFLRGLPARVEQLPRAIPPTRDLWKGIEERVAVSEPFDNLTRSRLSKRRNGTGFTDRERLKSPSSQRRFRSLGAKTLVLTACVAAIVAAWFFLQPSHTTWTVQRLDGTLMIGEKSIAGDGALAVGEWLETDNGARARINVGRIGEIEVDPNSRLHVLQARESEHRIELEHGTIHATIWAPPRLFFVETPSATAIDLGCAYTLAVDKSGNGLLKVSAGYVALQHEERESIVPAGAACETRPETGPGIPFRMSAAPGLRDAIRDFDSGNQNALDQILADARPEDAITLWHLLQRTMGSEKELVFDRLAAVSRVPPGVTREGILRDEKAMFSKWGEQIGLGL